jgi:hypothetical protein
MPDYKIEKRPLILHSLSELQSSSLYVLKFSCEIRALQVHRNRTSNCPPVQLMCFGLRFEIQEHTITHILNLTSASGADMKLQGSFTCVGLHTYKQKLMDGRFFNLISSEFVI